MKKTRFTERQIVSIIKQHESGRSVKELAREHGISENKELESLLADNEDVKTAFNDLISKLPVDYVNNSFSHLNNPEYWSELDNRYKVRSPFTIWRKLSVAQKSVELKLSDGTMIDLIKEKGNLTVG